MFTGLVEQIGTVQSNSPCAFGARLSIDCNGLRGLPQNGDSIAVSGCCLTLVGSAPSGRGLLLDFDVIAETLQCTTLGTLVEGDQVNLEQAMRADARFGGHFVQGHIDACSAVVEIHPLSSGEQRIRFALEKGGGNAIIAKGSIAVDGVSLTIAAVETDWYEVCLIPTTLQETTLVSLAVGDVVNREVDMLARTVAQVVENMKL